MTTSIRFDSEIEKRLSSLAKLTGRTKTFYIKQALMEKIDEMEDIYIAEHRVENPSELRWNLAQLIKEDDLAN